MEENKTLDEKNIVEKYTKDGQVKVGLALIELERICKNQEERIKGLEEAMIFFSEWYNKTQRVDILVPEHLAKEDTKIILPSSNSIMD